MTDRMSELISANDLDALVEAAGSMAFDAQWDELVDLRDRCRAALVRGLQLWPAAAYAEYRLALDGPGPYAAAVLGSPAERFTLGPFAEVAASTHGWADLAPFLENSPEAATFAHERIIRGEDLTSCSYLPDVFGLPCRLLPWEPSYPTALYLPDRARFDAPVTQQPRSSSRDGRVRTEPSPFDAGPTFDVLAPDEVTEALRSLMDGWTGVVLALGGEGDATGAMGALASHRSLALSGWRINEVPGSEALAWMAWAGASGGAHGRRRGMAAGRSKAWWAAAALCGIDCEESIDPDELGRAIGQLRWYVPDRGRQSTGWELTLAVEDPEHGVAWVLDGRDR